MQRLLNESMNALTNQSSTYFKSELGLFSEFFHLYESDHSFDAEEVIIEVIPSASDTIEVDGSDPNLDMQMPMGMSRAPVAIHLDHLHNVYVAAGTLACAVLIVIVTVNTIKYVYIYSLL